MNKPFRLIRVSGSILALAFLLTACFSPAASQEDRVPVTALSPTVTQAATQASTQAQEITNSPAVTASATSGQGQTATPTLPPIAPCMTSGPSAGKYKVTLCFKDPADSSSLSKDVTITAALTPDGKAPGVERMMFSLNGAYLLTDYQEPYTFTLPTEKWADGTYELSVSALMRDGFTSDAASVSLQFKNGITQVQGSNQVFQPATGTAPAAGQPFVVVATGDGASGEPSSDKVAKLINSLNPNLFLYLGDVYEKGTLTEFENWYGSQGTGFDSLRSITDPTIGNHEYTSGSPQGYFEYWDNIPNYYSFNAGGWHFISLNANNSYIGVDSQSDQYRWLAADLAANANACTIAFYHQPLFNIGPEGPAKSLADVWALLAQNKVTLVLNGHDHDYQRWVPLDANGNPSPTGVTEFVAGGGGHGLQTFQKTDPRVAFSDDQNPEAFGALKLVLNPEGASFSYINSANAILDSGSIACNKGTPTTDTQAPSVPAGLSTNSSASSQVVLTWQAATDNVGVNGYTLYRDGQKIATLPGTDLTYTDNTTVQNTTYQYTLDAFDAAGNHSQASPPVGVTTASMPSNLTFITDGDTYVSASSADVNYGSATVLRVDASPEVRTYLRFTVKGLGGASITRAQLQVYVNDASQLGLQVQSTSDSGWDEQTMTMNSAPAVNSVIASSGPIAAAGWVTLDVTAYVAQEGTYSFALTTLSNSAISLQSREAGSNSAQLVLDLKP